MKRIMLILFSAFILFTLCSCTRYNRSVTYLIANVVASNKDIITVEARPQGNKFSFSAKNINRFDVTAGDKVRIVIEKYGELNQNIIKIKNLIPIN